MARSELGEAARGLAKVGRMELVLGDAQAAAQVLAYSLVIALELELRWAEPGLWTQLGRCLDGPGALTCLALAGGSSADVAARRAGARGERPRGLGRARVPRAAHRHRPRRDRGRSSARWSDYAGKNDSTRSSCSVMSCGVPTVVTSEK